MDGYTKEEIKKGAEEEELNPQEKAAILMVALGEESAGEVMKYLADYEIEELTQTITELKHLPAELQDSVLEEFEQHLLAGTWVSQGGVDFARSALERAVEDFTAAHSVAAAHGGGVAARASRGHGIQ